MIGAFRSDLCFKKLVEKKGEDFDCYQTYWLGHVLKGLQAGYTYQQCQQHRLFDIGLQAGLTPEQLLSLLGSESGYIFPDPCIQTSS